MPPRISQPALLRFNWLAANGDVITSGTQPTSTPICGWVVPNYLDVSLMAYDADGAALGSVARVDDQIKWLAAPTRPNAFGETDPAAKNGHLNNFLNALIAKGKDYLIPFLDTLNQGSSSIHPLQQAQTAQLPVLVGQPLALVRTRLELNLMAPAAINNNWAAFQQDVKDSIGKSTTSRTTNGHDAVRFPVLVGSVEDADDGLLGFYLNSSFDTFHSIVVAGADIPTRTIGTVTVSVAGGPVELSMLIDPRCDIHATTGYMPTQSLRIPIEMFRAAFDNIAVTFLTAPILVAAAGRKRHAVDLAPPAVARAAERQLVVALGQRRERRPPHGRADKTGRPAQAERSVRRPAVCAEGRLAVAERIREVDTMGCV